MTNLPAQPRKPDPGAKSLDDRRRELGSELVTLLSAIIRIGRAYSVTNQVFRTQLGNIAEALRPILEQEGEAVFVALDADLYLNGVRVPVNASSFRFHQTVIESFRSREISGMRVESGVDLEELGKFFMLFLGAECPHGPELLKACLGAGLQRIQPAIHASTEPSYAGSDPSALWDSGEAASGSGADRAHIDGATGAGRGSSRSRGGARSAQGQALRHARSLLTTTALQSGIEMRHAKRVVQPLVDGAFSTEPVVLGLSTLREHDEYTYAHAVNVSAIAVTMGHFLELDRRALADLGVAALLHDVGKSVVGERIFHPLEGFTDEERAAAESHPLEGAKLLARSTALNPTTLRCMRVALEHHSVPGTPSYPNFSPGWRTSLLSQIVAVADCYVSLQNRRADMIEDITPSQALGMILGPLRPRFEASLLWALVQSVGFYPPGQIVELDDGSIAIVLAPNPQDLARPQVRVIVAPDGRHLGPGEPEDYTVPPERSVHRPLPAGEYPREEEASEAA